MKHTAFFLALFILNTQYCVAQDSKSSNELLRTQLQNLITPFNATVGVAVIDIESGESLAINNQYHYPMQSVYKFPLALAVLHRVDKKKISLEQKIHVSKEDLRPNTWSPLQQLYPNGNIDLTIAELLDYTVSKSDNNTCDLLFQLMGGTKKVEKYIHKSGYKNIAIKTTEAEMAIDIDSIQKTNWCTPFEMVNLLVGFYKNKHLSEPSNQFLMKLMTESSNSTKRIKGLLPESTNVAHKIGTGNHVVNDVGIVTLPNKKHIAIAVFVQQSKEEFDKTENLIAEISKTIFDHFNSK